MAARFLLYVGIALLSGLGALELGLWLDGRAIAQLDWQRGLLAPDPERGWAGRPGASRWIENGTHDVFVANAEDGYRLPDPVDRPLATHRILVLGGSTAWGKGVGQANTLSDWLRRELPGWTAVRSRAMQGYSLDQIHDTLTRTLETEHYDEVVLVLSPLDLHDGDASRGPTSGGELPDRFLFPRPGLRVRLEEASRAAMFLSRHWDRLTHGPSAMPVNAAGSGETEAQCAAMAARVRAHGANLVLVYASTEGEVSGSEKTQGWELRGQLSRAATEAGISFLDLTDALRSKTHRFPPEELFDPELGISTNRASFIAAHALIESGLLVATRPAFSGDDSSHIEPLHDFVQYSGRFQHTSQGEMLFDWSGATIRVRIEAEACRFLLRTQKEHAYFNVFMDGEQQLVFRAGPEGRPLELRGLGPGPHEIEIQKRYQSAPVTFSGLELPAAGRILEPAPPPERRIEILGASVAGGLGTDGLLYGHRNLGNERRSCADPRRLSDVNATFGAILADWYGAEVHFTTRDAVGLVRNYKDPEPRSESPFPVFFPRAIAGRPGDWEGAWMPDLVVMNLGENDFSNKLPLDEDLFRAEYVRFLEVLRDRYPDAHIIAFDEADEEPLIERISEAIATRHEAGDAHVELVTYPDPERHDKGCKSHPTAASHRALARSLAGRVERALGWSPASNVAGPQD